MSKEHKSPLPDRLLPADAGQLFLQRCEPAERGELLAALGREAEDGLGTWDDLRHVAVSVSRISSINDWPITQLVRVSIGLGYLLQDLRLLHPQLEALRKAQKAVLDAIDAMKQQNNSTEVSPDKAHLFHDAALSTLPALFYPETAYLGWRPKKGPHDTLAWRAAAILLHTAGMTWESIALLLVHYELTEGGEAGTVLDRIRKASSDDYSRSVTSTLFPMIAHRPDGRPREPMAGIDDRNFLFAGTGRSPTVNESRTVASLPENVTRLFQLCLPSYPHGSQVDYAEEGQQLFATAPALAALVVEMALLASGADGIRPGTAPVR